MALVKLWVVVISAILALQGCGTTRDVPFTAAQLGAPGPSALKGVVVYAQGLRTDATVVSGGHHEGIAQVRQPWIWGISGEQREALYGDLKTIARYAFLDELRRLGLVVRVLPPPKDPGAAWALRADLVGVELNTYGRGLSGRFEGFGSAGNYWEAKVSLAHMAVLDQTQGSTVWQGDIAQYAKLPDSPVKLEMNEIDLLANSLRAGVAGADPLKVVDTTLKSKASYAVSPINANANAKTNTNNITNTSPSNPVELAARLAARELVQHLATHAPPASKRP